MKRPHITLERFATAETLATTLADRWVQKVRNDLQKGIRHRVALSGGRVAAVFQRHAAAAFATAPVNWQQIDFFWGDERCVPPDHADSNFRAAREALLDPAGVPLSQIHRLRGELQPAEAAAIATNELRAQCPTNSEGWPVLDLVMLGMGEDGHIASLFPNTPTEDSCSAAWVVPVIGPKPPPQRLSYSFGVLAAAREVWVLASGADKANALRETLSALMQSGGTLEFPAGQESSPLAFKPASRPTPLAQLLQMRAETTLAVEDAIFRVAIA